MQSRQRSTILDAVVAVLLAERAPQTMQEIYDLIVQKQLVAFGAKDPLSVVRAAVRKHLRHHGGIGQPTARLQRVEQDRYRVA